MAESSSSSAASGGTSIAGLLGVAFVVLKLTGVIGWSWWWVTAPFWGGLAIAVAILGIGGLVIGVVAGGLAIAEARRDRRIRNQNRKRLGR